MRWGFVQSPSKLFFKVAAFPNICYVLFSRLLQEMNTTDLGNVPSGILGYEKAFNWQLSRTKMTGDRCHVSCTTSTWQKFCFVTPCSWTRLFLFPSVHTWMTAYLSLWCQISAFTAFRGASHASEHFFSILIFWLIAPNNEISLMLYKLCRLLLQQATDWKSEKKNNIRAEQLNFIRG